MKISPARTAAFDILQKIEIEKAFSSVLLPLYEEKLSIKDRGLCHELVLGVLRRKLYLNKIIEKFVTKKLDIEVRIAFWLGIYQLLFLDKIPAYSAINESVNLVRRAKKGSAKGLVNAVLRKVTQGEIVIEHADDVERVSVETSHPRWLIERWTTQFGFEEASKLAHADNDPGKSEFRATSKLEIELTGREDIETLNRLAAEGKIYFQDRGSQMVASVVKLGDGDRFLDVCAAPGSKTTQIADRNRDPRKLLTAGDLHTSRVNVLKKNTLKQGLDLVQIVQYDAETSLPFADSSFDVVLIDAPCSGTGTIRHNPEIRYYLDQSDFVSLSNKQLRILENASKLVKPGGKLIYSTCSLEREENEDVCQRLLTTEAGLTQIAPDVPAQFRTSGGFARTFPHRDGMDGFFIAVFEKNSRFYRRLTRL